MQQILPSKDFIVVFDMGRSGTDPAARRPRSNNAAITGQFEPFSLSVNDVHVNEFSTVRVELLTPRKMGRRAIALAALGAVALLGATDAASVSLTDANFDKEVFDSGKNAFVKFQAPWCDPVIQNFSNSLWKNTHARCSLTLNMGEMHRILCACFPQRGATSSACRRWRHRCCRDAVPMLL
jgi:hypothetical protein